MSIELGPGVTFGPGVRIDPAYEVATAGLIVNLDADTFGASPGDGTVWVNQVEGPLFTLPNGATYSPSNGGQLILDGVNQSAHGTDAGALTTFSAESWVNFTSIPTVSGTATCTITEVYNSTPINYTIGCGMGGDATLWQGGYFNSGWQLAGTLRPELNTWYCMAVTFDGTYIKFYVNGVLNDTATVSLAVGHSGLGIHCGERWDAPSYPATFLDGSLPIVRLYNRALTPTEISGNFKAVKGRFGL